MSRKISRKKPKGAPHAAIRDLSEAQKRRVSIIGMTSVIYQSFAGMSYVDAIAEAEKHVDACCASPGPVSGHQMSLADMEAQIDTTGQTTSASCHACAATSTKPCCRATARSCGIDHATT